MKTRVSSSVLAAFLCLAFAPMSLGAETLERLDPHGKAEEPIKQIRLEDHSECKVCHKQGAPHWELKATYEETCTGCHGRLPHSGVADHLGKKYQGKPISCFSCHVAHRIDGKAISTEFSKVFTTFEAQALPEGLKMQHRSQALIRHTCTECHSWK